MTPGGPKEFAAVVERVRGPVIVCSHVNPDGDAIGSVLGLTRALRHLGLDAAPRLADEGPVPPAYEFLPGVGDLQPASADAPCDLLVALDSSDPARLGLAVPLLESAGFVFNIDHHPDNPGYGTHTWVDPQAPAVGAMIWEALDTLGVPPSADLATCLYAALMTDTGRFQHDNTTARALRVAADMVDAGADPTTIARHVYQSRTPGALALTARVLDRLTLANGGLVAYSWFDEADLVDCGTSLAETEDLVDWVRMTSGPEVAVLARIGDGETKLSLRARGPFDVGAVAQTLGGGGHRAASGATVVGDLKTTLEVMLPLLPGGDR